MSLTVLQSDLPARDIKLIKEAVLTYSRRVFGRSSTSTNNDILHNVYHEFAQRKPTTKNLKKASSDTTKTFDVKITSGLSEYQEDDLRLKFLFSLQGFLDQFISPVNKSFFKQSSKCQSYVTQAGGYHVLAGFSVGYALKYTRKSLIILSIKPRPPLSSIRDSNQTNDIKGSSVESLNKSQACSLIIILYRSPSEGEDKTNSSINNTASKNERPFSKDIENISLSIDFEQTLQINCFSTYSSHPSREHSIADNPSNEHTPLSEEEEINADHKQKSTKMDDARWGDKWRRFYFDLTKKEQEKALMKEIERAFQIYNHIYKVSLESADQTKFDTYDVKELAQLIKLSLTGASGYIWHVCVSNELSEDVHNSIMLPAEDAACYLSVNKYNDHKKKGQFVRVLAFQHLSPKSDYSLAHLLLTYGPYGATALLSFFWIAKSLMCDNDDKDDHTHPTHKEIGVAKRLCNHQGLEITTMLLFTTFLLLAVVKLLKQRI